MWFKENKNWFVIISDPLEPRNHLSGFNFFSFWFQPDEILKNEKPDYLFASVTEIEVNVIYSTASFSVSQKFRLLSVTRSKRDTIQTFICRPNALRVASIQVKDSQSGKTLENNNKTTSNASCICFVIAQELWKMFQGCWKVIVTS